jgi:NTE family protein
LWRWFERLSGGEEAGCEQEAIVTGDRRRSVTLEMVSWISTIMGRVKDPVHGACHAMSYEHLLRCLAMSGDRCIPADSSLRAGMREGSAWLCGPRRCRIDWGNLLKLGHSAKLARTRDMLKNKIAIACQGGGSQTAFTAGVLKSFFQNDVHKKKQIVSLSGTSGGAVCATLSWYSLLKAAKGDVTPIENRLVSFWRDNSTQNIFEEIFNSYLVNSIQLVNKGMIPEWKMSPASPVAETMLSVSTAMLPRKEFYDFEELLKSYIDFNGLHGLVEPSSPVLVIGAANVLKGQFKKFSSRKGEIELRVILASAAVPSIFPAVTIGKDAYWDGLFSDNPPTDELLDPEVVGQENKPDEIWVIQINPKTCKSVPKAPEEIADRRNEMIGNESLFQDLQKISLINKFLEQGAFAGEFLAEHGYKPVEVRIVEMSSELQHSLNYSTKINRSAGHINRLIEDGEKQGKKFLESLAN